MVKSSRKSTAAALSTSENPSMEDGAVVAAPSQDNVGLMVLNSHRPARYARAEAEPNDLGEQIGEQLRGLYEDVLNQPIPDRFLELLNRLESDPISPQRSKAPGEG
ncbi:hypothetical protein EDE12_101520 [Methylosinus sp. sav-2]|nr:hypothetical protein EDE12_101520 [Methylosinus sp. sav-2]